MCDHYKHGSLTSYTRTLYNLPVNRQQSGYTKAKLGGLGAISEKGDDQVYYKARYLLTEQFTC